MMSKMLGAPLGGTTRGGHQGFEPATVRSILPPNFGSGGGSCAPLMVVVALGEPGTPVVSVGILAEPIQRSLWGTPWGSVNCWERLGVPSAPAAGPGGVACWARAGTAASSRTRPAKNQIVSLRRFHPYSSFFQNSYIFPAPGPTQLELLNPMLIH